MFSTWTRLLLHSITNIYVYEFADLYLYCFVTKGTLNLLNQYYKHIKIGRAEKFYPIYYFNPKLYIR